MKRLVVSFVGKADIAAVVASRGAEPKAAESSPLLRLLTRLIDQRQLARDDRLLVLDDHAPNVAGQFCEALQSMLDAMGASVRIDRREVATQGPTNLNDLYEQVFRHIPSGRQMDGVEVMFHLSSGTSAMHTTLVLAASCLPLDKVRLFETSREKGVVEVDLPYVIALREARRNSRAPLSDARLPPPHDLMPGSVLSDPAAAAIYGAIRKASAQPGPVLLTGPVGCGKAHAARHCAHWRGGDVREFDLSAGGDPCTEMKAGSGTVLLRHLDAAPTAAMSRIAEAVRESKGSKWLATWRTDTRPAASLAHAIDLGFAAGGHFMLPALAQRSDVVELAESFARQQGLRDTRIKERFQYELFTDTYAQGLHGLRALIATGGALALSPNLDYRDFALSGLQSDAHDAAAIMQQALAAVAGLRTGQGASLENLLKVLEHAAIRMAQAGGRKAADVAQSLGYRNERTFRNRQKSSEEAFTRFATRGQDSQLERP